MITNLNRVSRELLKIRHDFDYLNLQTQQLGVDLHSFTLELKKRNEVEQPVVSIEETQNHEGNEVNLNIPPRFDEYEEEIANEEDKGVQFEEEIKGYVGENMEKKKRAWKKLSSKPMKVIC